MSDNRGAKNPAYQHGFATRGKRPAIYGRWRNMINRCHAPSAKDYARYGAVGVHVCDRWRFGEAGVSGFLCWLQDMGAMPEAGMTVERVDGTKGYEPGNCCWASPRTQANNRKSNWRLTAMGQTHTIAQWARIVDIGPKTIAYRLRAGASPEEALMKRPNHGIRLLTNLLKDNHEKNVKP